jgi:type II secretory pathway component PulK
MNPRLHTHRKSLILRSRHGRDGAVLVVTLVSLLVVAMILGSMFQGIVRAHRQLHRERDLRQTELLLQAGRDRAAALLAANDAYRGETWNLPADAIVGAAEGRVTIETSRDEKQNTWNINVLAEYPRGSDTSIRRSRTFQLPYSTRRR